MQAVEMASMVMLGDIAESLNLKMPAGLEFRLTIRREDFKELYDELTGPYSYRTTYITVPEYGNVILDPLKLKKKR